MKQQTKSMPLISLIILICLSIPCQGFSNVQELADVCRDFGSGIAYDANDGYKIGQCEGYFIGILQTGRYKSEHCFMHPITIKQFVLTFLKWVSNNPEQLHLAPIEGIDQAAKELWPCLKNDARFTH